MVYRATRCLPNTSSLLLAPPVAVAQPFDQHYNYAILTFAIFSSCAPPPLGAYTFLTLSA